MVGKSSIFLVDSTGCQEDNPVESTKNIDDFPSAQFSHWVVKPANIKNYTMKKKACFGTDGLQAILSRKPEKKASLRRFCFRD